MPADDKRRTRVDFSPPYFVIESTLSRRWPFRHQDACGGRPSRGHGRRHRRIDHLARRRPQLEEREGRASEICRRSHGEMMKAETAQAFALTHDALPTLQKQLPGSRILDGAFQTTGVAIAVQKDRPAALEYVKYFVESAKANGVVRRAFDDAGLNLLPVAP